MAYREFNGHVTDDPKSQVATPIRLQPKANILKTAGDAI